MKNKLKLFTPLILFLAILISACSGSKTTTDKSQGEDPLNEQIKLIEER